MIANAEEETVRHFSNASRFSVIDATSVVDPGPPEVSRLTMSNILKFSMPRKRIASMMNGSAIGSVIDQNCRQAEARSTSAASYRSSGIERRPARQISITYGVHIQVSTMMIAHGASLTSPIIEKLDAGIPVSSD